MKIEIKYRYENKVKISGEYASVKECCEKNNANLYNADLSYADLYNANLYNANLSNADLLGIKNYSEAHPVFFELVRKEKAETFTQVQWSIIGQIQCHTLCWDSIKKRFGKGILPVFEVLAKKGFGEFLEKYTNILND